MERCAANLLLAVPIFILTVHGTTNAEETASVTAGS